MLLELEQRPPRSRRSSSAASSKKISTHGVHRRGALRQESCRRPCRGWHGCGLPRPACVSAAGSHAADAEVAGADARDVGATRTRAYASVARAGRHDSCCPAVADMGGQLTDAVQQTVETVWVTLLGLPRVQRALRRRRPTASSGWAGAVRISGAWDGEVRRALLARARASRGGDPLRDRARERRAPRRPRTRSASSRTSPGGNLMEVLPGPSQLSMPSDLERRRRLAAAGGHACCRGSTSSARASRCRSSCVRTELSHGWGDKSRALIIDDSRAMRARPRPHPGRARFRRRARPPTAAKGSSICGANGTPDVALVDWNMPQMSGIEFVAGRAGAVRDVRRQCAW